MSVPLANLSAVTDQDQPAEGERLPPFTESLSRSRGFAGYAVKCPDMLLLYQHRFPYPTEDAAREALANVEEFGACPFPHKIVPVYHTKSGRKPKDAKQG
jgi:hypothetical protein